MSEVRREVVYWVIEKVSKCEVCEVGWEAVVYLVIEQCAKSEVGKRTREVSYVFIESGAKGEIGEVGREGLAI
jgi:hypothetical protein